MALSKIGVLGSGDVGQTLANGFIKHGYSVMMGSRSLEKLATWKKGVGEKAATGSFSEAAAFGDIVVVAVKGTMAQAALGLAGEKNLNGKTIIDVTNPIADAAPENGVLKYFTTLDKSLMEQLQAAFPKANFVKAFNSIGNAFMVNPDFGKIKPTMFIAGNSEQSKKDVAKILDQFGFEVEDMGKAEGARAIEPLCMLWCIPGMLRNEWAHAFKLLKK
jgi:8-hydroxy-5-deazaflavin:NADPH oxidoreductase